jgi:GNAT superfamily N-acetyltransferase
MACQIRGNKYFAPNGEESILYKELESKVGEAQAKDLFVLSYTKGFKKEVIATEVVKYRTNIPTLPKELKFRESNERKIRTFHLTDNGKIGRIQLTPYKNGFKIKSVLVDDAFKGQGYGKALYIYAVRKLMSEGVTLYTDLMRTDDAERVWKSLEKMGITSQNNKVITPYPADKFDINGEIKADRVIQYAMQQNEVSEPLSFVEQQEIKLMMTEFPNVEDSERLTQKLIEAFYNKDGLFAPTKQTLDKSKIYSKYEVDRILGDVKVLATIKETVEKLKKTELLYNNTSVDNVTKTGELNSLGKISIRNPFIVKQDLIQELGGTENPDLSEVQDKSITQEFLAEFKRVPVINELGEPIVNKIVYTNAVKVVEDEKIFRAISALINAPSQVDTSNLESKLSKWLLDYGIDIEGFTKDLLPSLYNMLKTPNQENIEIFSNDYRVVFNTPEKQREQVLKIENKERNLVYLETLKTEQQLFDELNLLKTEQENVYHVIEKVDFEQMKEALVLDDNISELQAYKDYFNYNTASNIEAKYFSPSTLINSVEYLTGEFIADFNIEKLKNKDSDFYSKFEVNEKGIILKYDDLISLSEIQAYIQDGVKLGDEIAEYSLISKQMYKLKTTEDILDNRFNQRIDAVNNFYEVSEPSGQFTRLNSEVLVSKNTTDQFLRVGEDLFEQQSIEGNMSIYGKIDKNSNLIYNELNPKAVPEYTKQIISNVKNLEKYNDVKKKWKEADLDDNFSCAS